MRLPSAMMLSRGGYNRRCSMPVSVQQSQPIAHLPLVLGVLRRLEVATVIDGLIPPHPAHGPSCGRGAEALVLAILDGHHALYTQWCWSLTTQAATLVFYRLNSAIESGTKPDA